MLIKTVASLVAALTLATPDTVAAQPTRADPAQAIDSAFARSDAAALERLAGDWLERKGPGSLSVGLVQGNVQICFSIGDAWPSRPAEPRTAYEIASVTKTFTGLLLAQAATDGLLALHDPVAEHLPGSFANLAFQGQPVRLEHLASMTSGLPDNLPPRQETQESTTASERAFARAREIAAYSDTELLSDLAAVSVKVAPGAEVAHSNVAAEVLGLVLERAYSKPYEELVSDFIELPAGMSPPTTPDMAASLNLQGELMPHMTASSARASAGLRYSVSDMVRYAGLHLDETRPSVALAHEPVWKTLDGALGISLGWIWHADSQAGRRLRASGGSFGFAAFIDVYPDTGLAVVLLTNGADDPTQDQLQALSEAFIGGMLERPLPSDSRHPCSD